MKAPKNTNPLWIDNYYFLLIKSISRELIVRSLEPKGNFVRIGSPANFSLDVYLIPF